MSMQPQSSIELYAFPGDNLGWNILLVEDRQSDIELIEEALKDSSFSGNFYVTRNGEEALDFLFKKKQYSHVPQPHLVLLDLNLPRMSGFELLSIIKQDKNLKLIPIIVLTTSSSSSDVIKSYRLHANCYIVKPGNLDQFFRAVREIVNYWLIITTLPQLDN